MVEKMKKVLLIQWRSGCAAVALGGYVYAVGGCGVGA